MQELPQKPPRRLLWALLLGVVLLYSPSLRNGYVMDDEPIVGSTWIRERGKPDPVMTRAANESWFHYFGKLFVTHYWNTESHNDGLYRPTATFSYAVVYQLAGRHLAAEELPQHVVNVLCHAWAVWLVVLLSLRFGLSPTASLLCGVLFGVHAIHSEVVSGIVGRAEMFAFCFGAQALLCFARPGLRNAGLAALLFLAAFGAKESALAWIPFALCFQLARGWQTEPGANRWAGIRRPVLVRLLAVLGAALVPYLLLRWYTFRLDAPIALAADYSSNPLVGAPAVERVLTATKVLGYGLWLCVAPFKLSCLYGPAVFSTVQSAGDPWLLGAAVLHLGLVAAGLALARRVPALFLAVACFYGFAFLTSNIPLAIGTVFGERLYYTPSLGVCLGAALWWDRVGRTGRRVMLGLLTAWCAANAAMTVHRCLIWHDTCAVFKHDVEVFPESIDLQRKVAACYSIFGPEIDLPRAIRHLQEAKRIYPDFVHAYRELADIYRKQHRYADALAEYRASLTLHYAELPGAESMAHMGIGDCLAAMSGRAQGAERDRLMREALHSYRHILDLPQFGDSHRKAFQKLFEKAGTLLPRTELAALYERATKVVGEDHKLAILMGVAAYRVGLPPSYVTKPMGWAFQHTPAADRTRDFWLSQLFYSDALLAEGRGADARQLLEVLLTRPELDAARQAEVRQQLREDPRLRH